MILSLLVPIVFGYTLHHAENTNTYYYDNYIKIVTKNFPCKAFDDESYNGLYYDAFKGNCLNNNYINNITCYVDNPNTISQYCNDKENCEIISGAYSDVLISCNICITNCVNTTNCTDTISCINATNCTNIIMSCQKNEHCDIIEGPTNQYYRQYSTICINDKYKPKYSPSRDYDINYITLSQNEYGGSQFGYRLYDDGRYSKYTCNPRIVDGTMIKLTCSCDGLHYKYLTIMQLIYTDSEHLVQSEKKYVLPGNSAKGIRFYHIMLLLLIICI